MNIYHPPDEKDAEYSRYATSFKIAAKIISPDSPESRLNDWLRNIRMRVPYFINTHAPLMAVASYLADGGKEFSVSVANSAISAVMQDIREDRDPSMIIIDVKRYYDLLTSPL